MTGDRLPHGYTNATRRDDGTVDKRYLGPDARARQHAETTALRHLAGRFPVPALVHEADGRIGTRHVRGVPGQELLERQPDAVLHSTGRTAAHLHRLGLRDLDGLPGLVRPGAVLVHGDFGPQNLLLDEDTGQVTAVVDWEFAHVGDGVLDVAWAEWIVRTHHPHLVRALPSLFEGYGREPAWEQRQAAMVRRCTWLLDFVTRWSPTGTDAQEQWRTRLAATRAFRP